MSRAPEAPIISVIDDDASVRLATEDLVNSLGFTAHGFESAEAFLRSPQLDRTACLITDVQMPAMTGLELQKRLLAQGNRMPIIFITAFPEPRIQRRAEAGGAVAFLEKPFDGAALVGFIRVAMRRGGVGTAE